MSWNGDSKVALRDVAVFFLYLMCIPDMRNFLGLRSANVKYINAAAALESKNSVTYTLKVCVSCT